MHTANSVKARATKLHEVLGTMGYTINQAQCLDVVSYIEEQSECNTRTTTISDSQGIAEQYMDRIVEAFMEQNYEKAMQFYEEKFLVHSTEKGFRRDVLNSYEDLGAYVRREFLGSLRGESYPDEADTYPDHVRYVWRGIFEKNEGLLILGLYLKNDTYYTSDISCK